jgi:hypothetical protein
MHHKNVTTVSEEKFLLNTTNWFWEEGMLPKCTQDSKDKASRSYIGSKGKTTKLRRDATLILAAAYKISILWQDLLGPPKDFRPMVISLVFFTRVTIYTIHNRLRDIIHQTHISSTTWCEPYLHVKTSACYLKALNYGKGPAMGIFFPCSSARHTCQFRHRRSHSCSKTSLYMVDLRKKTIDFRAHIYISIYTCTLFIPKLLSREYKSWSRSM